MIRTIIIVLILSSSLMITSLLHGCGDSGTAKAAGTYELDRTAMKAAMQAEIDTIDDPSEKYMATVNLGAIDSMPQMTFVLASDGSLEATSVMMGMTDTAKGNWSIKGSTITFRMTETGEDDPDEMTGTLKGNRIELNAPEGVDMPFKLVFIRQKA